MYTWSSSAHEDETIFITTWEDEPACSFMDVHDIALDDCSAKGVRAPGGASRNRGWHRRCLQHVTLNLPPSTSINILFMVLISLCFEHTVRLDSSLLAGQTKDEFRYILYVYICKKKNLMAAAAVWLTCDTRLLLVLQLRFTVAAIWVDMLLRQLRHCFLGHSENSIFSFTWCGNYPHCWWE